MRSKFRIIAELQTLDHASQDSNGLNKQHLTVDHRGVLAALIGLGSDLLFGDLTATRIDEDRGRRRITRWNDRNHRDRQTDGHGGRAGHHQAPSAEYSEYFAQTDGPVGGDRRRIMRM